MAPSCSRPLWSSTWWRHTCAQTAPRQPPTPTPGRPVSRWVPSRRHGCSAGEHAPTEHQAAPPVMSQLAWWQCIRAAPTGSLEGVLSARKRHSCSQGLSQVRRVTRAAPSPAFCCCKEAGGHTSHPPLWCRCDSTGSTSARSCTWSSSSSGTMPQGAAWPSKRSMRQVVVCPPSLLLRVALRHSPCCGELPCHPGIVGGKHLSQALPARVAVQIDTLHIAVTGCRCICHLRGSGAGVEAQLCSSWVLLPAAPQPSMTLLTCVPPARPAGHRLLFWQACPRHQIH